MEVRKVDLVYKNDNNSLKVLYDRGEAIILYGDRVRHFKMNDLQQLIQMGLFLEWACGSDVRQKVQDELLEIFYEYELKNKTRYKDEKTEN